MLGPTDLGPPTDGGLVDLFDLGLSDMAGEMGDMPGFSAELSELVTGDRPGTLVITPPLLLLKLVLNLRLSGMLSAGRL